MLFQDSTSYSTMIPVVSFDCPTQVCWNPNNRMKTTLSRLQWRMSVPGPLGYKYKYRLVIDHERNIKKPIFNKWVRFPLGLHLPIEPQKNKDICNIPRLGLRLALCSRPWSGYDHMWMQPGHMLDLGHCTCMARMWWLCGIFLWNLNKWVYKLFGVNPRNLVHKIVTLWLADLVWRNLAMKTVISGEPMISLWFPGICFRLMFFEIFSNTEL